MDDRGVIIRKANNKDGEGIAYLVDKCLGSHSNADMISERINNQNDKERFTYVAEYGEKLVGFIDAELYSPIYFFDRHMNIAGVATDPKFQKCGVATKLINELKQWCLNNGVQGIRADSNEMRKDAHAFYRAIGFSDEKKQLRFYMKV